MILYIGVLYWVVMNKYQPLQTPSTSEPELPCEGGVATFMLLCYYIETYQYYLHHTYTVL